MELKIVTTVVLMDCSFLNGVITDSVEMPCYSFKIIRFSNIRYIVFSDIRSFA